MFGCLLVMTGLTIILFSNRIVFPGLERLLGIETIVGKDSVQYQPDGSYYFTNPTALMKWVLSVAILGFLICASGVWIIFRIRKKGKKANQSPTLQ